MAITIAAPRRVTPPIKLEAIAPPHPPLLELLVSEVIVVSSFLEETELEDEEVGAEEEEVSGIGSDLTSLSMKFANSLVPYFFNTSSYRYKATCSSLPLEAAVLVLKLL